MRVTFLPAISTEPVVGASMQPIRFKSVVLPLPEGPTTVVNRSGGISSVTPRSARTSVRPTR